MPAPEPRRTVEEMLAELEKLDQTMELKLDRAAVPPDVRRRFEELRVRLEECRALAARRATRAKNVLADTLVAYRELAITSLVTITTPVF